MQYRKFFAWGRIMEFVFPLMISFFVLYFLACLHLAYADKKTYWSELGTWQMFTSYSTKHYDLVAEVEVKGKKQPLLLEDIFYTKWDSGYRYSRPSFARKKSNLKMLAASICSRFPEIDKIVLSKEEWDVILGVPAKTVKKNRKQKVVRRWDCREDVFHTPKGARV